MLKNFYNWLGFERTTFSKKKELEKLRKIFSEVKWREALPHEIEGFSKLTTDSIITVAVTNIKEVAGIIDNRLRVFDFSSPGDFVLKKFNPNIKAEKDDYVVGFTDSGLKLLSKKSLKPLGP